MTIEGVELQRLELRQNSRLRMLRHMYVTTNASTRAQLDANVLGEHLSLTLEASRGALDYLVGEGLAKRVGTRGVSLTHQGIVEAEAVLQRKPTEHFSLRIIQQVEQHFHAPVGAVQMGLGATANVEQDKTPQA